MIKATCPTCGRKKAIAFRLASDAGDLAVETKPCEHCRYELTEEEKTEKVTILVQSIMKKTRAPKVEAFTRALALMVA